MPNRKTLDGFTSSAMSNEGGIELIELWTA
jgi:hypothetical protein